MCVCGEGLHISFRMRDSSMVFLSFGLEWSPLEMLCLHLVPLVTQPFTGQDSPGAVWHGVDPSSETFIADVVKLEESIMKLQQVRHALGT